MVLEGRPAWLRAAGAGEAPVVRCAGQPSAHHGAVADQRVATHLPDILYRPR